MVNGYKYDGDGMRVLKTAGGAITVYHHDKSGKLLSETDTAGNRIADYVYVNGNMAAKVESAGTVSYYHVDPAGTPVAITDSTGALLWRAEYLPFGEEQLLVNTKASDKMFIGKEKDKETGLYYFGARYMQDRNARFVSVDPVGPVDAAKSKTNENFLLNPQNLNRYSYSLNNPYRYLDPDGKWPTEVHNTIITRAFSGHLSTAAIASIQRGSRLADSQQYQDRAHSHIHAMRAPGQSAEDAAGLTVTFIIKKVGEYKDLMSKGDTAKAYEALGMAMHPLMDATSPSHEGYQEWRGIAPVIDGTTKRAIEHKFQETQKMFNSNPEYSRNAVDSIRNVYNEANR